MTGSSGEHEHGAPRADLPASEPVFTRFGGAGGEEGSVHAGADGGARELGEGGATFEASGAGGEGGTATEPLPALLPYFSEYVEGSGSFKALEIFAPEALSLEGCELQTYFNGKTEPARLALHERIEARGTYVLCSAALAGAQPQRCQRSTALTFNGDDALALSCRGTLADVFGRIGEDPGSGWGGGVTADHTLRRSCQVTSGRTLLEAPFTPAEEWATFDQDAFDDLGLHSCD